MTFIIKEMQRRATFRPNHKLHILMLLPSTYDHVRHLFKNKIQN